jgi:hypothetical protein
MIIPVYIFITLRQIKPEPPCRGMERGSVKREKREKSKEKRE